MITIARIVSAVEAEDDENLLREVAKNFIVGNPLLHSDKIAPLEVRFDNFALNRLYAETEGINCLELEQQNLVVLGNPPWEKLRFEERAFFRPVYPAISAISQKNKREKEIKKLAVNWLELLEYYQLLQDDYASVKKEIPKHPLLKVSLVGELNTYGTITTPWDGSWFLPWERKTARPMFLTHVGTRAGDYWQSKKSFRYWRLARKQGMKNLLKTRVA